MRLSRYFPFQLLRPLRCANFNRKYSRVKASEIRKHAFSHLLYNNSGLMLPEPNEGRDGKGSMLAQQTIKANQKRVSYEFDVAPRGQNQKKRGDGY